MEIKEFNNKVIERFTADITDIIFQYIMEDDELMSNYLDLVSAKTRQIVNSHLGKAIKQRFEIENQIDEKTGKSIKKEANCVLIKSKYTKHKLQ